VFQSYALFPHMSVRENVAYGLLSSGVAKRDARDRAEAALATVGLAGFGDRLPSEISGGQQQRVAVARALVLEPDVLLFDEPLSNLDARLRRSMREEIRSLQQRLGLTVVYVTHDQSEALTMADRIAVLHEGRLHQIGAPEELYDRPANSFVADFIGETNFIKQNGRVVAVRPERLQILRAGQSGRDGLGGEIVTTMVIGPAIQCLVRTDNGQEVLVRQQRSGSNGEAESFREGERVVLTWPEDAALELDETEGGEGPNE
jgi:ABC-type Fe3+/spermidine/putrescine transport system ATPase subunit